MVRPVVWNRLLKTPAGREADDLLALRRGPFLPSTSTAAAVFYENHAHALAEFGEWYEHLFAGRAVGVTRLGHGWPVSSRAVIWLPVA